MGAPFLWQPCPCDKVKLHPVRIQQSHSVRAFHLVYILNLNAPGCLFWVLVLVGYWLVNRPHVVLDTPVNFQP